MGGSHACAGNDSGGECGVAVAARFTMPNLARAEGDEDSGRRREGTPPPSKAPFWYSYEYGAAHFTVISTEHDLSEGSDQREVQPSFVLVQLYCATCLP